MKTNLREYIIKIIAGNFDCSGKKCELQNEDCELCKANQILSLLIERLEGLKGKEVTMAHYYTDSEIATKHKNEGIQSCIELLLKGEE